MLNKPFMFDKPFALSLRTLCLTLLLAGVLIAGGCDTVSDGGEELSNCNQDDVLMPLCLGNTWSYETARGDAFALEAAETVATDSTAWTVVKDSETEAGGTFVAYLNTSRGLYDAEYHERDDDLDPASSFFRFPVEDGTTYTFGGTDVTVTWEPVEVPAGSFDVYTYVLDDEVEGRRTFSFAPGVGLVQFSGEEGTAIELASRNFE